MIYLSYKQGENMSEEKTSESNKDNKNKFSLFPFWAAGFLFTLGYVGIDPSLSNHNFWEQVFYFVFNWFLWPFVLGLHLAGH